MTFASASAIISRHSANVHRGIAQLVEQRSPKPRAVSSRLTTPATNAQVLRSLCVLFLRCFCVLELAPLRSANISGKIIFICTSGKSADFPEVPFHGRGRSGEQYFLFTVPVTGEVVPGSSISAPAMAGAAELLPPTAAQRLPLRGSWHGKAVTEGVIKISRPTRLQPAYHLHIGV